MAAGGIRVEQVDAEHVIVWRVDYTTTGQVLLKMALLPHGCLASCG
jgi:hypothetical protein